MVRIPVIRFKQSYATLYVGKIRVSELRQFGIIESWDPDKGWDIAVQGYQRASYEKHYIAIAKFLRYNPDTLLPTSILLSARTREQGELNFEVLQEFGDHAFGYLEIREAYPLYVVDGQHRLLGFDHAIEILQQKSLQDFLLPVVILYDADKVEELTQFHLINDRQKRIATNLALALLGTVVEDRPDVAKMLVGPKSLWRMKAIAITILLNEGTESENVWSARISLPNEPRGPAVAVSLASFVKSLQPYFSGRYPHKLSNEELRYYLITFWSALNRVMPESFRFPREYVIQRTTGVYSLNRVGAELARQKPDILKASSDEIKALLEDDKVHMGANKWISGGKFAQEYRGHQRFRDLADEILIAMGLEPSRPPKKP